MDRRDVPEPFFHQAESLLFLDVSADGEDGVVGGIVTAEKCLHVPQTCAFDVFRRDADGRPAVGVYLVCQRAQFQPDIPVGLVEVTLFELFDDYLPLDIQSMLREA